MSLVSVLDKMTEHMFHFLFETKYGIIIGIIVIVLIDLWDKGAFDNLFRRRTER